MLLTVTWNTLKMNGKKVFNIISSVMRENFNLEELTVYKVKAIKNEGLFYQFNEETSSFEVVGSESGAVIKQFDFEKDAEQYCDQHSWINS